MACRSSKMKKYNRLPKAVYGLGLHDVGYSENMGAINQATGQNKGWFGQVLGGEKNIAGAKPGVGSAIGAVGTVGSGIIDSAKSENVVKYTDSGPSWSQSAVGSFGPWGAAISGVSQMGESALEAGYNMDEFGNVSNKGYHRFAESFKTGALDPAQNLEVLGDDRFSAGEKVGSMLLPGLAGWFGSKHDQEDAQAREREYKNALNQKKLSQLNKETINYNPVFANGGDLKTLQPKYPIVPDPEKLAKDTFTYPRELTIGGQRMFLDPFAGEHTTFENRYKPAIQHQTSTVRDRVLRPKTFQNTIDSAVNDFGMSREDFKSNYQNNPKEFIQGLASQMPNKYKARKNSLGKWSLYEYMPSNAGTQNYKDGGNLNYTDPNTPIVNNYKGQKHSGPDGGIPVDKNGTPSAMTGNTPVALTENNEISYNGYIFSDTLKTKK